MRILWLCNIVLPELADIFGFKKTNTGGWLTGAWNELKKENELELGLCVPVRNPERAFDGEYLGYKFFSFLTISSESDSDIDSQIERFCDILDAYKPDVIHVWGTEFEHSYSMIKACEKLNLIGRVVVNIQGIITQCEKLVEYGVPKGIVIKKNNGQSIRDVRISYLKRSKYEQYVLKTVKHVIGRTEWDRTCIEEFNSNIEYHFGGEILRDSFYSSPKWCVDNCVRHSIFMSQAYSSLKGLHVVLNGIKDLSVKFPDLIVKIAGTDLSKSENPYHQYIMECIDSLGLKDKIIFLGSISEEKMIEEYLYANVYLSPSILENSSNSVCEAMMIGLPVVASMVGGIPSIIKHGISGYMYPLGEPELMVQYVERVFQYSEELSEMSACEIQTANNFNNKEDALQKLLSIYGILAV